jgi:hypothetical protein
VSYRLPLDGFATGAWSRIEDMPHGGAFQASACTDAVVHSEIWSIGGMSETIQNQRPTVFRGTPGETCDTVSTDVPWLRLGGASLTVKPGSHASVGLTVDTRGLAPGVYRATVLVRTDDPGSPTMRVPVELTVV